MTSNLEKVRVELKALVALGIEMSQDVSMRKGRQGGVSLEGPTEEVTVGRAKAGKFEESYQMWYTEAAAVVKQLIPERASEFRFLYEAEPKRRAIHGVNFTIQDWLNGVRSSSNYLGEKNFDDYAAVAMRFQSQLGILQAAERRFDSRLLNMEEIVRADLFDSELDKARELLRFGFDRPAGVIAGVVLEEHLQNVCSRRSLRLTKKSPTIADLNDLLKNERVIDNPAWRFVQRLGDIRNLCGHKKERDPTKEEVQELIDGTDKTIKTVS
jgi:hypothetical protein